LAQGPEAGAPVFRPQLPVDTPQRPAHRLSGRPHLEHGMNGGAKATTLDPASWAELRATCHKLLDAALDRLEHAREGRVWTPPPSDLKEALADACPPAEGASWSTLQAQLEGLLPFGVGNTHPRFFGWVQGSGSPGGLLPEITAAAMNANCGGREHAAMYVERQVLAWSRSIMGFPADSGGLLVSGTSMATVVALKAARDKRCGFRSRKEGLGGAEASKLVGYTSQQSHSCLGRAFDFLGLGADRLRPVPCNDQFQMDVDALAAAVAADREAGLTPFLVVGTAGAVNVGSVDDLSALADFSERNELWFHVDGAFGAAAMLSPELRPLLRGLERASSLAFDFHKWFHVNYDCGCVLVRDRDAHLRAFSDRPDYLADNERGIAAGSFWAVDFGPELSRGFRALKVWSHFLEHGTRKLGASIHRNVEHARVLAAAIDEADELERLAPVVLQIVVFRYVPPAGVSSARGPFDAAALDALNDAIVIELQESGIAAPSTTRIHGRLVIRVSITNHRTEFEDLELLVREVRRIGAELAAKETAEP